MLYAFICWGGAPLHNYSFSYVTGIDAKLHAEKGEGVEMCEREKRLENRDEITNQSNWMFSIEEKKMMSWMFDGALYIIPHPLSSSEMQ